MLKARNRLTSLFRKRRPAAAVASAPSDRETTHVPPPSPNYQFQPGELVGGRFRILRPLGQGGMGEVYEAEDELLHDVVALKTIRPSGGGSESLVTRFEQEVQLAKKVTHPNVCRIHDIGVHQEAGRNQGEKALEAFRRVVELEPEFAYGFEGLGLAYFRQYAAAIEALQKAVRIQEHPATYTNLGTAYFYARRYDAALKMFDKAVQLQPDNQLYLGNLADAYRRMGQNDRARALYDRAIARAYKDLNVNPRATNTMASLALYYAKKGEPARAFEMIGRARAIDAADVDLVYDEAVVRALAGRNTEAIASLREPDLENLWKLPEFQQLTREFAARR